MAAPRSSRAQNQAALSRDTPSRRRDCKLGDTSGHVHEGEPDNRDSDRGTLLPRDEACCPAASRDDLWAAPRRSRQPPLPGDPRRVPRQARPEPSKSLGVQGQACSCPVWSGGEESGTGRDRSNSVSSGRLSGSSGGHEYTPPPRLWKELLPQGLGAHRQPQGSDLRLERLRDKIRAQAACQASSGSLGTSAPSSASRLCKGPKPASRKKVRKVARLPAAQPSLGSGVQHPEESPAEEKASSSQGRESARFGQRQASASREKAKRTRSCSCRRREKTSQSPSLGRDPKGQDADAVGVYAWRKGQGLAKLLLGPPPTLPGRRRRAPTREPATTEELEDSKKVPSGSILVPTQAHSDQQVSAITPSLASRDQPANIQTAMAILQDLRQQIQARLDMAQHPPWGRGAQRGRPRPGLQDSAERRHLPPWDSLSTPRTFSKRPWAVDKDGPSERAQSFPGPQPYRVSARREPCPQKAQVARAWDPLFQRPGSPPEEQVSTQRPWSASAGGVCEDTRAHRLWNLPEKPRIISLVHPVDTLGTGSLPGLDAACEELPSGHRARGIPGSPHSSESLRDFMRQRAQARRRQALEEKALTSRARELRGQRLRDLYRKQKEAVLGRPAPVVSQHSSGIVTFVPHASQPRDLDTPGSLSAPVLQWSKVTSGLVLGDQEAPGSFCLCLNKAFSRPKTHNSSPLLLSDGTPRRPWQHPELSVSCPPPHLCIYLDPEEDKGLGKARPLHFQYKQARLQALEATANVLKQRVDILTQRLQSPVALDPLQDPALGSLPSSLLPSPEPNEATLTAPASSSFWVPSAGEEAPVSSPSLSDSEALPSDWEWQQAGPWNTGAGTIQGLVGHRSASALEQRLPGAVGSFHRLSALLDSSLWGPATLDALGGPLQLEEELPARRAWTTPTCGGQGPGRPHPGDLQGGHLTSIQQKSLSFLKSLKLDHREQAQALALLQQKVEREIRETQATLDSLLLPPPLQPRIGAQSTQAVPGTSWKMQRPQVCGDLGLQSAAAGPSQEARRPSRAPSRLPVARKDPWEPWRMPEDPDQGFGLQMLEQSLQEEELHAQHQAALLRLREKALQEKVLAELAWLEHQRGCLAGRRDETTEAVLEERKQLVLSDLQQEQKEIRCLRAFQQSAHRERSLLLQHRRDVAFLQRCTARLQQELQAHSMSPAGPRHRGPKTSPRPEEGQLASGSPTPCSTPNPASFHALRSPKTSPSTQLPSEQVGVTPPLAPPAGNGHLPPSRPAWGEDTAGGDRPGSRGQPVESCSYTGQGDPQTGPSPETAEEGWLQTESRAQSQRSPGGDGPPEPQEASQVAESISGGEGSELGLHEAGSPTEGPQDIQHWRSDTQRLETCRLEDPPAPSAPLEAAQPAIAAGPGAAEDRPPREASPLTGLSGPSDRDPESALSSGSGWSSAGSSGSLCCPSLQEFQKALAVRVDLSESSASLPDLEAEDSLDTGLRWAGPGALQALGCSLSEQQAWPTWGLPPGEPRVRGASGGQGPEASMSSEMAEAGSSGPAQSWLSPFPDASRPRSGSELSDASSQIWGEDSEEDLGCGATAEPASGHPLSGLENKATACKTPASPGSGETRDTSGAGLSLASVSNHGSTEQESPGATPAVWPPRMSPARDLDLSLSLSPETSAKVEFNRGEPGPPPAGSRCSEGPQGTIVTLPAVAGDPEIQAPWFPGARASATAEEAGPHRGTGVLTEILSPVDEVLSYSSIDLPASSHRDPSLPSRPLELALPAEGGGWDSSICSGDFPSPPEEVLGPGASPGPLGEDTSLTTDELPSWPEENVPEVLLPSESGCPWGAGPGRPHKEGSGMSVSVAEKESVSGQYSLCRGAGDCPGGLLWPSTQPPPLSWTAGEGLPTWLVVGEVEHQSQAPGSPVGAGPLGNWDVPWTTLLCPESGEGQAGPPSTLGPVGQLDVTGVGRGPREVPGGSTREASSPHPTVAAPPPGGALVVATSWIGPLGLGDVGDQGCQGEGPTGAEDAGPRDGDSGQDREAVVAMVSTRLTRRILQDSLAALSELARGGGAHRQHTGTPGAEMGDLLGHWGSLS